METKTVILTAREDKEYGGIGLVIQGVVCPEYNPAREGLVIAHDLLEHPNGAAHIGTIDDELEALGGIWFVRGQFGQLRKDGVGSYYTPHENIASEIVQMFRKAFYGEKWTSHVPAFDAAMCDVDLTEIIRIAGNTYPSEFDSEEHEEAGQLFDEFSAVAYARMCIGFKKASMQYANAEEANTLFWLIADAVDPNAKWPNNEGADYVLTYGINNEGELFADCRQQYDEETDEDAGF